MAHFLSDNVTGACAEVMDAVVAANSGAALSYGDNAISASLQASLADVFETELQVFLRDDTSIYPLTNNQGFRCLRSQYLGAIFA
jgi:threonine aldolase